MMLTLLCILCDNKFHTYGSNNLLKSKAPLAKCQRGGNPDNNNLICQNAVGRKKSELPQTKMPGTHTLH